MTDTQTAAIRARLRYETLDEFVSGYARYISAGGIFIPLKPHKLKPQGSTVRFQFLLHDGDTALLGEGRVHQVHAPDPAQPEAPVGILVKFTKLSQSSKRVVEQITQLKRQGLVSSQDAPEALHEDSDPQERAVPQPQFGLRRAEEPAAAPEPNPPYEPTQRMRRDETLRGLALGAPPSDPHEDSAGHERRDAHEAPPTPDAAPMFSDALKQSAPEPGDEDFFSIAQSYADGESPSAQPSVDPDALRDSPQGPTFDLGLDDEDDIDAIISASGMFQAVNRSGAAPIADSGQRHALERGVAPAASALSAPQPQQQPLARTEGGLQIMAYDNATDLSEESKGLAALSLGDDDDEFDEMFDNIFSGDHEHTPRAPQPTPAQPQRVPTALPSPVIATGPPPSAELNSLLSSLEDSSAAEPDEAELGALPSLNLGPAPEPDPSEPEEDEDEESLASLLALARRDIEELQGRDSGREMLEALLGDDVELPPTDDETDNPFTLSGPIILPTGPSMMGDEGDDSDAPEATPEEPAKKRGLFSSLFGKKK